MLTHRVFNHLGSLSVQVYLPLKIMQNRLSHHFIVLCCVAWLRWLRSWGLPTAALFVFVLGIQAPARAESTEDFKIWYQELRDEALALGISRETVKRALPDTIKLRERVIKSDRNQAEKKRTVAFYLRWIVTEDKIKMGRLIYSRYYRILSEVEHRTGVSADIITALWGVESYFGAKQGKSQIIPSLVTLAYDKRRGAYFRRELLSALQIIDAGDIALKDFKGSWAGAMGQIQFMPSSFLELAVDGDGDGKRDIWNNPADVVNSAANYLKKRGWHAGQKWGHKVYFSKPIDRDIIGSKETFKTLKEWNGLGVQIQDEQSLSGVLTETKTPYRLIQPDGKDTQAYLVSRNYDVLLKWNRSTHFALSVGLLSNKIKDKNTPKIKSES